MGRKLNAKQMELYRLTDEVLHYIWDPIGVAGSAGARDEYQGYLPQVFQMVLRDEPVESIANHLLTIETSSMGLEPVRDVALRVAQMLRDHKDHIWDVA